MANPLYALYGCLNVFNKLTNRSFIVARDSLNDIRRSKVIVLVELLIPF